MVYLNEIVQLGCGVGVVSKISIRYSNERIKSPLGFWVHKALDAAVWDKATQYEPPLARYVSGKGYPTYGIEYKGHYLYFCSEDEINHCIDVLSKKVLPAPKYLAKIAGHSGYKHLHWLTKWPADIKSWKDRQQIVKYLNELLLKAT